jgi:hypothetical protein
VARLGKDVRTHLAWLRDTYPGATPYGLARLATRRFVRQARNRGAVAGLAGSLAVLADPASLAWTQAKLVLHIAAAYGLDPTDPRRAAELLVLQGVHKDLPAAEEAVARAQRDSGTPSARLAAPLTRFAGRGVFRLALVRGASRLLPGAAVLVSAVADARGTEHLAHRAAAHYRRATAGR